MEQLAVRSIGEPLEAEQRPETGYQAQFSGPYMVALGFFGGGGLGASLDDFTDELASDPARRALMSRVTVVSDPTCVAIYPYQFPAVLTVRTRSGEQYVEEALVNRGGSKEPLSDEELATKFRDNAGRAFDSEVLDALADRVGGLGHGTTATDIMTLVARDPRWRRDGSSSTDGPHD